MKLTVKQRLLYTTYKVLKYTGYISIKNAEQNYATILNFHRVNDSDKDPLTMQTAAFEEAMEVIGQHYRVCSLQHLLQMIRQQKPLHSKTVVITFDDGYKDNFTNAAPILYKHNIPATFFITSGYINTNRIFPWDEYNSIRHPNMNWDEVRELVRMGFDIGGHTVNHVNLGKVSPEEARREIVGCKEQIEREINREITAFAYPFGRKDCINNTAIKIISDAGFSCCCSGFGGKITSNSKIYSLQRVPTYPSMIELFMEIDNFMTYFDGKMDITLHGQQPLEKFLKL